MGWAREGHGAYLGLARSGLVRGGEGEEGWEFRGTRLVPASGKKWICEREREGGHVRDTAHA